MGAAVCRDHNVGWGVRIEGLVLRGKAQISYYQNLLKSDMNNLTFFVTSKKSYNSSLILHEMKKIAHLKNSPKLCPNFDFFFTCLQKIPEKFLETQN